VVYVDYSQIYQLRLPYQIAVQSVTGQSDLVVYVAKAIILILN